MAKKMVRDRARLIEKKRAQLAAAQAQTEEVADKLDVQRGNVSKLDVSDGEKAITKLAKLTGQIASGETVLKALEAKRDRAQVELDEILATLDQDEIDRLKEKEADVLRLAVHQVQELHGTMEALYDVSSELRAAGGRTEDLGLPSMRGTMEHLRVFHPEMIGLPPRRSSKEMQAVALARQIDTWKRLRAEVKPLDHDGNLTRDYTAAIKRGRRLLKRLGVDVKATTEADDDGLQLPSLGEFTENLIKGKEHGPTA